MHPIRYFMLGAALIAAAVVMADRPARAADEDEQSLIDVLRSDAPPQDKAITCKKLAVFGSKNAVPALAPLLADKELTSWARIALEVIPGAEADAALRDGAGKLQGRILIGVINSIGVRRDAGAVELLAGRLKDVDAEVASAAAVALGRIGNAAATEVLAQSLAGAAAPVRSAVAEGCILCAEKLAAQGKAAEAAKLYDQVRQADVPKQRVLEATRGAILARQAAGVPLLVEQLRSADKRMFALGLTVAREIQGSEATAALAAELAQATPDRQAMLLLALADRGDATVLPAVLAAAKSGPSQTRIAAVGVLVSLGNVSCVPALLDVAVESDAEVAQAATAALAELPGADVDADLAARLPQAKGALRKVLIALAGLRRIDDAVPALLKAAEDSDAEVRSAALTALGSAVGPGHLSILINPVVHPKQGDDAQAAALALREACVRMADREACAAQLVAAMPQAPVAAKCSILETLAAMGGEKALAAMGAAAKAESPELQDTASRLLGEWMTADAAPVLLDLAKTLAEAKYKIRAMRGYIRIARQLDVPAEQRAEMCRTAIQAADRDAEKKLVLEVLERYPSIDGLRMAVDLAKIPSLKSDAAATALVIAQKVSGNAVDVQALLAQIGQEPVKVEIIKAEYGAGTTFKDVTKTLQRNVRGLPLIVLSSPSYNSAFGGDPASGTVKQLKIQYKINGKPGEVSLPEDATIMLPTPK